MDIFGVSPIEIILILVLGLIVFGPERLPEIGRFLGRSLAKVMAWQQQSPEAQMIQQIRRDFDREIIELRDEIVRARQQLDISSDARQVHQEVSSVLKLQESSPKTPVIRAAAQARAMNQKDGVEAPAVPAADSAPAQASAPAQSETGAPANGVLHPNPGAGVENKVSEMGDASVGPSGRDGTGSSPPVATSAADTATVDLEGLAVQLQMLVSDVRDLQAQLQARGLLEPDWQSPSKSRHQEVTP